MPVATEHPTMLARHLRPGMEIMSSWGWRTLLEVEQIAGSRGTCMKVGYDDGGHAFFALDEPVRTIVKYDEFEF